jgi:type I restriction enzyme S subunit
VTGRYGTIGEVFYVEGDYWPLNTALYVVDFKGNDPRFAAYLLEIALKSYQSDKAAVPGVDRKVLHKLQISAPSVPIQRKVVDFLSAYDDLIENNGRRIALLEEAARQLYREWFVRLRFPGYEHAKFVNGLPEGWTRCRVGDRVTLRYGKALKNDDRVAGEIPVFGSSGVVGFHDTALSPGPGIIIGRKGNVGSLYWHDGRFFPIDTVYFTSPAETDIYLYYALSGAGFQSTDGAVPGLNREFAHSRIIVIPEYRIHQEFVAFAASAKNQVSVLMRHNEKLRAARDLLLPRLMSGELVV